MIIDAGAGYLIMCDCKISIYKPKPVPILTKVMVKRDNCVFQLPNIEFISW